MTAAHDVLPSDEHRHEPDDEALWNESYYCDFVQADGSLGGWLRLGLYPNLGVAWWTAWIVRPGHPGVCSVDYHMPIPPGTSLATESAPDAAHPATIEIDIRRPLEEFRLAVPRMQAQQFAQPEDAYTDTDWEPVEASLDLTWTTDGVPYHYDVTTRYEIPCLVSGTVTVGRRDVLGRRAGTARSLMGRTRLVGVRLVLELHAPGRRHAYPRRRHPLRRVPGLLRLRADAGPRCARCRSLGHRAQGRARTSARTASPDGQDRADRRPRRQGRARLAAGARHRPRGDARGLRTGPAPQRPGRPGQLFPRAMVQCRTDDGRTGAGWIEWNQPDPDPPD